MHKFYPRPKGPSDPDRNELERQDCIEVRGPIPKYILQRKNEGNFCLKSRYLSSPKRGKGIGTEIDVEAERLPRFRRACPSTFLYKQLNL